MKIIWFTWKDIKNPAAGGAEVVASELGKHIVKNGHELIYITSGYKGAKQKQKIDGYYVIRVGGRWSVYWHAYKYYKKFLESWSADLIIEEINTIPFFTQFYSKKKNRYLFFHQLCREIWFYQMFFPLSVVGYLFEPIYLWLLRNNKVITISNSTKRDLLRHGFKSNNISVISEGITLEPLKDLSKVRKFDKYTILSLGAIRSMKGTLDQVKAFELARKKIPELKMKIAGIGEGIYFNNVMRYIKKSPYMSDIEYLGRVSNEKKIELMQKSHLILVTSVKEGWGLIVTEANSQGTPAIVYNADGLRDSVKNLKTGVVVNKNNPREVANSIKKILTDSVRYNKMRNDCWKDSLSLASFNQSYKDFIDEIR